MLKDHPGVRDAVSTVPPAGAASALLFGVPLNEFLMWATLVYTCVQFLFLIHDKIIPALRRFWSKHGKANG